MSAAESRDERGATEAPAPESSPADTPLAALHRAMGATMMREGGLVMPRCYLEGPVAEHCAVRTRCGVFDVSHLGRVEVHGRDAVAFADAVTTNDVARLAVGQTQYSLMLTHRGTILDDCIVCRLPTHVMLVVNARGRRRVTDHLRCIAPMFDCRLSDVTAVTGQLAVQGPWAEDVLQALTSTTLGRMAHAACVEGTVAGVSALLARTGYTGEDGFELYVDAGDLATVWMAVLADRDVVPAGLVARDTLRLEAGMVRAGAEIDETRTPDEAGLTHVVKVAKGEFVGREALVEQRRRGLTCRLAGITTMLPDVPEVGSPVYADGHRSGVVLSAAVSPSLGVPLATCYLPHDHNGGVTVEIDGRRVVAAPLVPPFYMRVGTTRRRRTRARGGAH